MPDPGWYRNPTDVDPDIARWHDGVAWTDHTVRISDWQGRGKPPPPDETSPPLPVGTAVPAEPVASQPARQTGIATAGFAFDGGAGTYLGTGVLAFLVTVFTLGLAYPYALVLRQRWIAKHTLVNGVRLRFTGTGIGLFGNWVKWLLLTFVTLGIYSFWVAPRVRRWVVVHTEFDPACVQPETFIVAGVPYRRAS